MNMSYCRFHNTRIDLSECLGAIDSGEELSQEEALKGKEMFHEFLGFCMDMGIIDEYRSRSVDEMFDELREGE